MNPNGPTTKGRYWVTYLHRLVTFLIAPNMDTGDCTAEMGNFSGLVKPTLVCCQTHYSAVQCISASLLWIIEDVFKKLTFVENFFCYEPTSPRHCVVFTDFILSGFAGWKWTKFWIRYPWVCGKLWSETVRTRVTLIPGALPRDPLHQNTQHVPLKPSSTPVCGTLF